jgi:hypothetical protein
MRNFKIRYRIRKYETLFKSWEIDYRQKVIYYIHFKRSEYVYTTITWGNCIYLSKNFQGTKYLLRVAIINVSDNTGRTIKNNFYVRIFESVCLDVMYSKSPWVEVPVKVISEEHNVFPARGYGVRLYWIGYAFMGHTQPLGLTTPHPFPSLKVTQVIKIPAEILLVVSSLDQFIASLLSQYKLFYVARFLFLRAL